MTTIAVLGAARPLGGALLARLDADPGVTRILGLDDREPGMPVAKLDFRPADVRDRVLDQALDGADVVVHLPVTGLATPDEDTRFAVLVRGTRNLLEALARTPVRRFVHLSSAMVYGAQPGNAVPLTEDAPLRATPAFGPAYQRLLAEELVTQWAAAHPERAVTVLRPATMLGPGVDDAITRHLESPRLPMVRGHEPPLQVVHTEDVAAALHLAATRDLPGVYNVAAEGWLSTREVRGLLGRRLVTLPEEVALAMAERLWQAGLVAVPPGALRYLMHPWVVSSARLQAEGWAPERTNRDVLREFAAEHAAYVTVGKLRARRADVAGGAAAVALAATAALAASARRRRDLT